MAKDTGNDLINCELKLDENGELTAQADVLQGTEPGASRSSILIPTDSYEEIAPFLQQAEKAEERAVGGSTSCQSTQGGGNIRMVKSELSVSESGGSTPCDSDSEKKPAAENRSSQRLQVGLKPPESIITRIDTPTALGGSEEEADNTTMPSEQSKVSAVSEAVDAVSDTLNGVCIDVPHTTVSASEEDEAAADWHTPEWRQHKKHVFVLSFAGKPIYSRYGDEDRQASLMGAMHALVSFLEHSGADKSSCDVLRSIHAGKHRFVFLSRDPLILVATSSISASSHSLLLTLSYVYNQIISILTLRRMESIFSMRKNYDLRRLLGGVDRFMDCLLDAIDSDPCYYLGAVRCLPLDSTIRDVVAQTIAHYVKIKDLVFAILVADGQLITLVRLKKCMLHPVDLHIIFNLITSSDAFKHAESWTPVCLPKFDPSGYLYAHISYLDEGCHTCLLLLTVDKDLFFKLSECRDKIKEKLARNGCSKMIADSLRQHSYTVRDVGVPDVRHFLYKSRSTTQLTAPEYTAPYTTPQEQSRLFSVYQLVHDRMHNTSRPLKIVFYVGQFETVLGWITSGFELYAVFSPLVSKPVAISCTNRLLRWIKKEEDSGLISGVLYAEAALLGDRGLNQDLKRSFKLTPASTEEFSLAYCATLTYVPTTGSIQGL